MSIENRPHQYGDPKSTTMSRRDHFAAMAMQGIISRIYIKRTDLAKYSVEYADALIEELDKEEEK